MKENPKYIFGRGSSSSVDIGTLDGNDVNEKKKRYVKKYEALAENHDVLPPLI